MNKNIIKYCKKKMLVFLLIVVSTPALYAYDFMDEHSIMYISTSNQTVSVAKYIGFADVVHIPEKVVYNEVSYSVTSIGNDAFSGNSRLTEVTIPNSVTSIGNRAFDGCSGLTEITIPNSVISIGDKSFANCSSLTEMTLSDGDSVLELYTSKSSTFFSNSPIEKLYLGRDTKYSDSFPNICPPFENIKSLRKLTIGNNVTSIPFWFFRNCTNLTELVIGDGVTAIGSEAFWNCTELTSLTIGNSVTVIYDGAFSNCSKLTSLTIPNSVTTIYEEAFKDCSSLAELTIGNSVTSIGYKAFQGCSGLTEVTIPNNVTAIYDAFRDCSSLAEVTLSDGDSELYVSFSDCSIENLYLGRNLNANKSGSDNLFGNLKSLRKLTIGPSVTSISRAAFWGCSGLMEVTIPNSVTSIGISAFSGCSGLTKLVIGNNVTSIGDYAFSKCVGLTELVIPNSVNSIGVETFSGCSGLKEVTLLDDSSTLKLKSTTFSDSPIEILYLGRDISYYDSYNTDSPFRRISSLTNLTIGSTVTSIPNFSYCYGLTEVTISDGDSVLKANGTPFLECRIEKLYLGRNLSYNNSPFSRIKSLTSLTIGNRVTEIGYEAFDSCKGLTDVVIPNSVVSIGNDAFYGCSGLTDVVIPNSVVSIGNNAFCGCSGLTDVVIPNSVVSIGNNAFRNCSGLSGLTIGSSVTSIGENAFSGCSGYKIISYAATPPALNSVLDAVSLEVPLQSSYLYARDEHWKAIEQIYVTKDGVRFYPVLVFQEGNGLVSLNDMQGDIEVAENGTVVMNPVMAMENGYMVFYDDKEITAEIISNGCYSFPVSQFHQDNIVRTAAYPQTSITVPNSGALLDEIGIENMDSVYYLKISGDLNGTDILAIRKMANLHLLDLEDANIVNGGLSYYDNYVTSKNEIGSYFFNNRTNLQKILLPKTITSIGENAFSGMTNLRSISIPNSVTSIRENAFQGCKGLTELTIPNRMVGISKNAFKGCSGLKKIHITDLSAWYNITFANRDANPLAYAHHLYLEGNEVTKLQISSPLWVRAFSFIGCSGLTEVNIGNSVTSIGSSAFSDCSSLTDLTIGNNVTFIDDEAFSGCSSLTSVTSLNPTPPEIKSSTFDKTTEQNATLHVLEGCRTIYWLHPNWENFSNIQEDVVDGINLIDTDKCDRQSESDAIYTINGMKINVMNPTNLQRGIYIVNGKKYVVK